MIWIYFHNSQIGMSTQIKNFHFLKQILTIDNKWIPIKQKIAEIQISSNPSHIITRIQSPIQLILAHIIYEAQGLTLDPSGVTKHSLIYIALSQVCFKEYFY